MEKINLLDVDDDMDFELQNFFAEPNETMDSILTPQHLGQNPADNFMNAQLPQLPLASLPNNAKIDINYKEWNWWGDNDWNCKNNDGKEGLHANLVQETATAINFAEEYLQQTQSPEKPDESDEILKEFWRGAHVRPHSSEEDLFRRFSSEDQVDEFRMTTLELEAAAHRHVQALRRALNEILLRDEQARVSMMKRRLTAVDYPMQYNDSDHFCTGDNAQMNLDVFFAGSYNVEDVADI